MPMDPIARLARLEELRRSGIPVGPESLSDGLEGADTPIAEDPEMSDADKEAMFQRQANRIKTDDYRRERMLYRAAKATGTPVEELMQQPEWSGVGDARADDAVMPLQARAAMAQKRMDGEAERMDRWKSQMLLASSNSRANMSNAFGMLSPEQQQRVIESRLSGGRNYNNNDPRVAIAQLEAETRRAEGEAGRKSAAEIAEANRVAAREERQSVRESEERRYGAQQQQSQQQNDMVLKKMDQQQALLVEQIRTGQTAAASETALKIKGLELQIAQSNNQMQALITNNTANNASAERVATINADVLRDKTAETNRVRTEDLERAETLKKEAAAVQQFGPGATNIASGDYETPAAQDSLASAAEQADRSLSGFYQSDAARLDAILAQLGVTDPATRSRLVQKYGLDPVAAFGHGGRSGPISAFVNWMSGPRSSDR